MVFSSKIDLAGIDTDYPKLNQTNSAQGLRDNFSSIAKNLAIAATELTALQNKTLVVRGDVVGISSYVSDSQSPFYADLRLVETGVVPGTYDSPRITIDATGRVITVADGSGLYLKQTGGEITGNVTVRGNIEIADTSLVAGRNLIADGLLIDQLNNSIGILVGQGGRITPRTLEATGGLSVANPNGVDGQIAIGIKGFSVAFQGDVKGAVRFKSLSDQVVTLKLDTDNVLLTKGGKMSGTLDMNGNYLKGVKSPIYGIHVGDRDYNDQRYLRATQGNTSGFVVQRRIGTETISREIKASNGLVVKCGDGFDGNPEITAKDFKISLSGDVRGSGVVVGLNDVMIKTQLPNYYTKDETDHLFFNKHTDGLHGDLVVRGNIILPDGGTVDGRHVGDDGVLLDAIRRCDGFVVGGSTPTGRTITSSEQIVILNGDGVGGNPVISLASDIVLPGNGSVQIPRGSTAERKDGTGAIRFNTDRNSIEGYGTQWSDIVQATYGELPSDANIWWYAQRARYMEVSPNKDINIDIDGYVAGMSYVLFIHQGDSQKNITFSDKFKFAEPILVPSNTICVIEFHCDGKYLYGFHVNYAGVNS